MREITVLSGKGGAGKTTITAGLASCFSNAVFCDNDVDAADLHLIFNPEVKKSFDFDSGSKAQIDSSKCSKCGLCAEYCRFNAIELVNENYRVSEFKCEGCCLCEHICQENAIKIQAYNNNKWFVSDTRFGPLVHARMGAGEENSGRLVTKIRGKAKNIAEEIHADFIVNDGPPGIGCPVIASLSGTDIVILVVEPSISGLHDTERLVKLSRSFGISAYALINKFDINPKMTKRVVNFLESEDIPVIGKIPFDTVMVNAMVYGKTIVEYAPNTQLVKDFVAVAEKIKSF